MFTQLFSECFKDACVMQRKVYERERDVADNAQSYFSNRGAADCCDFYAGYCSELVSMGITGRDALVSKLQQDVLSRIELERARYFGSDSPSVYVDAVGWGMALSWLNCVLVAYASSPLLR